MKKIVICLFLISGVSAFAQTDRIDSLLNDLIYNNSDLSEMPEKPVKYDFLYAGLNYSSNSFYAGRELDSDMYNISGSLFYYHSSGLYFGTSGIWYNQLTPAYTNTTISSGYSKSLDRKKLFTFRTSYSRYFYNQSDSFTYYPYKNNVNLGFSFRKKRIGARISANLLFGDETKMNLSGAVYSCFNLVKFGKYNKIYTAPAISAFFSTETVSTTRISDQSPDIITDYEVVFSLLNTQIYVPVGISVGNFELELSYYVNLPSTRDGNISYPVKTFYSVSLSYMLPVIR